MDGESLSVGKRLSLHHNDKGWTIVGLPGRERFTSYIEVVDRTGFTLLKLFEDDVPGAVCWEFAEFKQLGPEHFIAKLIRKGV